MVLSWWFSKSRSALRRATMGDAAAIADLHGLCFAHSWSTVTIEALLAERGVTAHVVENRGLEGFVMIRRVLDEAEVLSIAVVPRGRSRGAGRRLMQAGIDALVLQGVRRLFLEVEAENIAALKLYAGLGFVEVGRRAGYYRGEDGRARDALTMRLDLDGYAAPPLADG